MNDLTIHYYQVVCLTIYQTLVQSILYLEVVDSVMLNIYII